MEKWTERVEIKKDALVGIRNQEERGQLILPTKMAMMEEEDDYVIFVLK